MQTHLAPEFKDTPDGLAAEAILRKEVNASVHAELLGRLKAEL